MIVQNMTVVCQNQRQNKCKFVLVQQRMLVECDFDIGNCCHLVSDKKSICWGFLTTKVVNQENTRSFWKSITDCSKRTCWTGLWCIDFGDFSPYCL